MFPGQVPATRTALPANWPTRRFDQYLRPSSRYAHEPLAQRRRRPSDHDLLRLLDVVTLQGDDIDQPKEHVGNSPMHELDCRDKPADTGGSDPGEYAVIEIELSNITESNRAPRREHKGNFERTQISENSLRAR
jgi:hypothetical protein